MVTPNMASTTRLTLCTEDEHAVFASWNAAETQKNEFDQKFDFKERGYWDQKNFPTLPLKWAETELKRSWNG